MSLFFKDLKVIELASVLAGPAAGMFFAELGAKVVKIENKAQGGDATRSWRLPGETSQGPSAYFCAANAGKEHLFLDLTDPADRTRLYEELRTADIVLTNYRHATALKLGVHRDQLFALKENLIFVQLEGFESSERAAYDVVLQAETGWISMTGTPEGAPVKMPVALIDLLAGHQIKEAALLALLKRSSTGKGSYVQISLEKSALSALANQATNYLMCGHVAKPMGTLHPNIAPYGDHFTTSCGRKVVLAIGSDLQFNKLCTELNIEEIVRDLKFSSNVARVEHRTELQRGLAQAIARYPLEELQKKFDAQGIPYGVIRELNEVLEGAAAKEMLIEEMMEGRLTRKLSGNAFNPAFLDI